MQNTKIQRWGVLLAEFGAQIKYRKGKNNIRADMLSRIPPRHEVATIDCDQWVDPAAIPDERAAVTRRTLSGSRGRGSKA